AIVSGVSSIAATTATAIRCNPSMVSALTSLSFILKSPMPGAIGGASGFVIAAGTIAAGATQVNGASWKGSACVTSVHFCVTSLHLAADVAIGLGGQWRPAAAPLLRLLDR